MSTAPPIAGLLETALYVDDMDRSTAFFRDVLGLRMMESGARATAFDTGRQGVLLLFRRRASAHDRPDLGGTIPGHDGAGPLHVAFAIDEAALQPWRDHLARNDVTMRGEVAWESGGRSLYFEDPDRHVLELATPGLWPNY